MNTAQNILKDLVGELKSIAKTETIVGAPVSAGEYTIIPISRVALGVGAGGAGGETEKKASAGEGGGGGGGIRVIPVALVAVRGSELHVHMLGRTGPLVHTIEKMPDMLERAFDRWQKRKGQEKEGEEK
ncbi:MAG: hypothetical protein KGL59_15585 [Acidobacteriota bacterium]|nr:hypothetical protein [Acidobacteriota bacterium]